MTDTTYPEINQLILKKLDAIPEIVLGGPVLDNSPPEVQLVIGAVHETLKVLENHLTFTSEIVDQREVGEGPDIQFERSSTVTTVVDLATQYFDMVSS